MVRRFFFKYGRPDDDVCVGAFVLQGHEHDALGRSWHLADEDQAGDGDAPAIGRVAKHGAGREAALSQAVAQKGNRVIRGEGTLEQFIAYFNATMAKPFRWTYAGKPRFELTVWAMTTCCGVMSVA
jgi:hypothetical protein